MLIYHFFLRSNTTVIDMGDVDIWTGDQLPTLYEVAQTIYHYSKKSSSQKRTYAIYKYAVALRNIWVQSFGEGHVVSRQTIVRRIEGVMKDYENRVVKPHDKASRRILNKRWMHVDVPQPLRGQALP